LFAGGQSTTWAGLMQITT